MRALLDVNMLIALFDAAHVHHQRVKSWLISQPDPSWASCPITQNGFIRVISQPAYPSPISMRQAVALLNGATQPPYHEFWAADVSFLDVSTINHAMVVGHRQITDSYLLALAVKHGGRLVTLDRQVPLAAVQGAESRHLVSL